VWVRLGCTHQSPPGNTRQGQRGGLTCGIVRVPPSSTHQTPPGNTRQGEAR